MPTQRAVTVGCLSATEESFCTSSRNASQPAVLIPFTCGLVRLAIWLNFFLFPLDRATPVRPALVEPSACGFAQTKSMTFLNRTPGKGVLSRESLNVQKGFAVSDHAAKELLYNALAHAAKGLSNGRRAELVDVLAQGERPVEELANEIGQTVANTSQHLQRLLRSGLVSTRRDGTRVYYSLSGPVVHQVWRAMRQYAEEHVEGLQQLVADYVGDRSQLRTITRDTLQARLREGDVVVLDVRPAPEYAAGHIRGAISIPVADLQSRLGELPEDTEVVAYCRGPYCVYADDAVRIMAGNGRAAARLEDGFPEWAAARLPTEGRTP